MAAQLAGLAGGIEPCGNRRISAEAETAGLDPLHPAGGGELFAPTGALRGQQAPGDMERRRPLRQGQAKAGVIDDLQRTAVEQSIGIGADAAHQVEDFAVGAEQDVLAVVEPAAGNTD